MKQKKILDRIQDITPDAKTVELLEAISRAKRPGGEFILDDDKIISGELRDLSDFAKFFLARCTFEDIDPERVNEEKKYIGLERDVRYDIGRLDRIAKEHSTMTSTCS